MFTMCSCVFVLYLFILEVHNHVHAQKMHGSGQHYKCTAMVSTANAWLWPALQMHGYGQHCKCMALASTANAWLWSALQMHGYGQHCKCMAMVSTENAWLWSALQMHGYGQPLNPLDDSSPICMSMGFVVLHQQPGQH